MTKFSRTFVFTTLLITVANSLPAATLTSSVNRNPIKINQTLTLTVQYSDQVSGAALDLNELAEDFEILSSRPSSNSSMVSVNGKTTVESTTTWTITLAAKREGVLNIPAFIINGDNSQPIQIQARSLTAQELAEPQPIDVTATIDDSGNVSIKPGEQIIVSIELSAAADVSDIRGEELSISGADLEPLGQQNGQKLENGVARQAAIWRYALFPQSAGTITLPTQTFTGTVGGRRGFFDSFGGQQVGGRSVEQTINIDPKPETNGNTWFPANNVSIQSNWSGDISEIRVGEPITRTITVIADGQRATAIPPLISIDSDRYKSYRDQPQLETTTSITGVVGTRIESEAIVPSQSGQLHLPEQRISWWNNKTDQWQDAVLPAETLTILAAITETKTNLENSQSDSFTQITNELTTTETTNQEPTLWLWKAATLLLGLLCLLQFYVLRNRPSLHLNSKSAQAVSNEKEADIWKQLQHSFSDGNPQHIRQQLLLWSRAAKPEETITNLSALAEVFDSNELGEQLTQLDKHIYSHGEPVNFEQLNTLLSALRKNIKNTESKRSRSKADALAPLYPA